MSVQYHLKLAPGDVAPYVLLPGDPGRIGAAQMERLSRAWAARRSGSSPNAMRRAGTIRAPAPAA
jgi:uridine phosphorylase